MFIYDSVMPLMTISEVASQIGLRPPPSAITNKSGFFLGRSESAGSGATI